MLKLVRYLKEFRKQVIIGPLFKLTEAIFELIVPLLMAKICLLYTSRKSVQ